MFVLLTPTSVSALAVGIVNLAFFLAADCCSGTVEGGSADEDAR
jgi:hypothetical protein